ncbi:glycerol 3-phosphate dehydrogenase-like [Corticium candelabrum]|uniref:glycerol 3-phosphate dehydrogenase-like n=1 Tax=Corticium candelabrum TaxID=121492 RepID=UPI002E2F589C|nr:glycerol 3-phosphate dehydrogenase-like [Corticium candelabrum]
MFDVAVIGGGVVGCAIARQLAVRGFKVVILEKEKELLSGASSGNSGITTVGFDVPLGSLELKLIKRSREINLEFYKKLGIPHRKVGALMVAWSEAELRRLPDVVKHAESTGVTNLVTLGPTELLRIEPNLNPSLLGGILFPDETVVDAWLLPIVYVRDALQCGAVVNREAEVTRADWSNDSKFWKLYLANGSQVEASCVVNAAGLYGDKLEECRIPVSVAPKFYIKPRKGQFVVFEKSDDRMLNHIIMPVPSKAGRGVLLFTSVYGDIVVGPTAEEQSARDVMSVDEITLKKLVNRAVLILPCLKGLKISSFYAGLRPGSDNEDYVIHSDSNCPWVTVAGIRSTGVSASLAIAEHVEKMIVECGLNVLSTKVENDLPTRPHIEFDSKQEAIQLNGQLFRVTHHLSKLGIPMKCSRL